MGWEIALYTHSSGLLNLMPSQNQSNLRKENLKKDKMF